MRPMTLPRTVFRFGQADAALLRVPSARAPKPDICLYGFVRILERGEDVADGTIRLRTEVDGQRQSVMAVLEQADYERAVQAHKDQALVVLKGDLERTGQRWRLLNPHIEGVLCDDGQETEGD